MAQSVPAAGHYAAGGLVFDRLVEQVAAPTRGKFAWELRIVDDSDLNAYSSPDGTVYVESGLARLAGASTGLWAAILSHEIAHILRRDWARRYLYQNIWRTAAVAPSCWAIPACLRLPGKPRRRQARIWPDSAARWNWKPTSRA